ncbi:MAG: diaminopimelate epimerase [Candidatus Zixiibacteriota bacterium]|nr:MAG: diaminopimelate epimerase [candidate division Zixibacteria bacterium]
MKKMQFSKYHGLGNDFLVIDLISRGSRGIDFNRLAEEICNRNTGVGADGILVLTGSRIADCCIDLFNSDGSWAEKSGNGLRIVAAYYYSHYSRKKDMVFEINEEAAPARMMRGGRSVFSVQVALGRPEFRTRLVPMKSKAKYHINAPVAIEGVEFPVTVLSVGNPHTVMFVNDFNFDWKELGRIIESDRRFPYRTNVEFVKIVNKSKVILNDWERGAGATGSSGTGAAASVVAGAVNGLLSRTAEVVFPLGSLHINWSESDDIIYLTGPVEFVCQGEYRFGD